MYLCTGKREQHKSFRKTHPTNRMSYETVIGLETHIQLSTFSKAFCSDAAAFGGAPNTHTSVISLAHPGTLPRLNKKAVEYAVKLGLALGCDINRHTTFDRKNYFYADLPKGFQTTQDRAPVCIGGSISLKIDKPVSGRHNPLIRIHHIHLEEDAGKSMHDQSPEHSYIDLNRAGVPLLEIVSEPDLRSPEEVAAYMEEMRRLVRWLGVSDGNMEEGSMRCDVNISIRPVGSTTFGNRCEIKNVNSMRFAKRAIEYEVNRQIALVEAGGKVEQETRGFDVANGVTYSLREKENAHDYRYFPEPDLPPGHLICFLAVSFALAFSYYYYCLLSEAVCINLWIYRGSLKKNYFTFSTTSTSLQRFVLLIGRVSIIFTVSPMLHSFFSS